MYDPRYPPLTGIRHSREKGAKIDLFPVGGGLRLVADNTSTQVPVPGTVDTVQSYREER